ncbi:MAG: Hpt domain-containing protein [Bdellovibrionota bacterium]
MDREKALRLLDGDMEIYSKIVEVFSGDVPVQLSVLSAALATNDIKEVGRVAHALKSAAATVGAEDLHAILFKLEKAAEGRSPESIHKLVAEAKLEIEAVRGELARS